MQIKPMRVRPVYCLAAVGILIKFILFAYLCFQVPDAKFLIDSHDYLTTAESLAYNGSFSRINSAGQIIPEIYRTPGYPFFLSLIHFIGKVPLSVVILLQIFLTLGAAGLVFAAVKRFDRHLAPLTFVFMLLEPSITVYSMMILTESLFLFLICLFFYCFVIFLELRQAKWLMAAFLSVVAAAYVRPVAYFLPAAVLLFICIKHFKKRHTFNLTAVIIAAIMAHALLGIWQARNYNLFKTYSFSGITNATLKSVGLFAPSEKRGGNLVMRGAKGVLQLYTHPVSLKYFQHDMLKKAGKAFAYPWIAIWMAGFIVGLFKINRNIYLQFSVWMVLYFTAVTVVAVGHDVPARFFVPLAPFVAVLAAHGWLWILGKQNRHSEAKGRRI